MLVKVQCPAKINPLLKVSRKDDTGYQPVEVIYQAVSLFDSLQIESDVKENTFTTNWLNLPVQNSLQKVLNFAKEVYDIPPLKIHLTKRIPIGSGLGGSSSDAAGLLRALEVLYPHSFPHSIQLSIANAMGEDIPFFLYGGRAKKMSQNEIIEPLEDNPSSWICIVKPSINISTHEAYKVLNKINYTDDNTSMNSFEKIMPPVCREIKNNLLKEQAVYTQLCGCGSAVYGSFLTKEQAEQAAILFIAKGFSQTFVVSTLTKRESLWISYF